MLHDNHWFHFRLSVIIIVRRSGPILILSFAFSNSSMVTVRLFTQAANKAALSTKFAKSVPEYLGVPRATVIASIILRNRHFSM